MRRNQLIVPLLHLLSSWLLYMEFFQSSCFYGVPICLMWIMMHRMLLIAMLKESKAVVAYGRGRRKKEEQQQQQTKALIQSIDQEEEMEGEEAEGRKGTTAEIFCSLSRTLIAATRNSSSSSHHICITHTLLGHLVGEALGFRRQERRG